MKHPWTVWTEKEKDVLRQHYLEKGMRGVIPLLPGRSESAISAMARMLGLFRGVAPRIVRPSSPGIDDKIRAIYSSGGIYMRGAKKELSEKIGRNPCWIYRRALALGLVISAKPSEWAEKEEEIVEEHADRPVSTIRRILAIRGYRRSIAAIECRLRKKGYDRQPIDHWTAVEMSRCMGVPDVTVLRWISKGMLKAARTDASAAGNWEISRKNAKMFLIENVGAWDHRRCDKWWLVDTLK